MNKGQVRVLSKEVAGKVQAQVGKVVGSTEQRIRAMFRKPKARQHVVGDAKKWVMDAPAQADAQTSQSHTYSVSGPSANGVMWYVGAEGASDLPIVLDKVPPTCCAEGARECGFRETWIRRCCIGIAARDALISADDRLDLAVTMWDRPSCRKTCPRMTVDMLFSNQIARLL